MNRRAFFGRVAGAVVAAHAPVPMETIGYHAVGYPVTNLQAVTLTVTEARQHFTINAVDGRYVEELMPQIVAAIRRNGRGAIENLKAVR